MAATVLSILDAFCDRINQPRESQYVGSTQPAARQYVELFKMIGDDLRRRPYQWPQLKRNWIWLTQTNVRNYPYPGDFYRPLEGTQFDDSNQIPMLGAISDRSYAIRSVGIISLQTQKAYQILGKTSGIIHSRLNNEYNANTEGYFRIDPPGPSETDLLSMGYLSKNWCLPAAWVAGASYTVTTSKVSVNGQIYTCQKTAAADTTIPPSVFNGIGSDGGTLWAACITTDNPSSPVTWAADTAYFTGQYIATSIGNYYLCATGGTSGSSEPSDSGTVTDGSVTWTHITLLSWDPNTSYSYGDYIINFVTIPGGALFLQLYMNVAINPFESVSGNYSPNWYWDRGSWYQVDGATYWKWQQSEYDLAADTDLCLFDKDVMIEGLRWAWYESKKQTFQSLKDRWENDLRSAYARFEAPCAVNAANGADSMYPYPNVPLGSWPGTGDV